VQKLINAADGNWDLFERIETPMPPSLTSRVIQRLIMFIIISIPIIIIVIIKVSPITLSDTLMGYIISASIIWVALNIMAWTNPEHYKKLSALKKEQSSWESH